MLAAGGRPVDYWSELSVDFTALEWTMAGLMVALVVASAVLLVGVLFGGRRDSAKEELAPETKPSALRIHSYSDIAVYVRRRDPRLSPRELRALTDAIADDEDAPAFGTDWSGWLERNHDRLLLRAARALEMTGGES